MIRTIFRISFLSIFGLNASFQSALFISFSLTSWCSLVMKTLCSGSKLRRCSYSTCSNSSTPLPRWPSPQPSNNSSSNNSSSSNSSSWPRPSSHSCRPSCYSSSTSSCSASNSISMIILVLMDKPSRLITWKVSLLC